MRRQELIVTPGSRMLAVASSIIGFVESSLEEPDPGLVTVSPSLDDLVEEVSAGARLISVGLSGLDAEASLELERIGVRISIRGLRGDYGSRLESYYRGLPRLVYESDSRLLKNLAIETSMTGVEYMVVYLDTGEAALLEGEYLKVSIPGVDAVGRIHTHPAGGCGLSGADVESGLSSLADGALFEGISTPNCGFYMARIGLVSEDDYIRVKSWRGEVTRPESLNTIVFSSLSF